jgi:beta-galactosidase
MVKNTGSWTFNLKIKWTGSLTIDKWVVGGDNSWGAQPHEQYTLPAQNYEFMFQLIPFKTGENLFEIYQQEHH